MTPKPDPKPAQPRPIPTKPEDLPRPAAIV
jgi:hypothetical protein